MLGDVIRDDRNGGGLPFDLVFILLVLVLQKFHGHRAAAVEDPIAYRYCAQEAPVLTQISCQNRREVLEWGGRNVSECLFARI